MKKEVKIILEQDASNKAKGTCFENLIRNLLSIQQFEIRGNINFSGMEIDLVANHKDIDETLYVECKAKEKVSADEISKFAFNVDFKEVDKGYFFRTQELQQQAGALLNEMKGKTKYKNLTFFEPGDIIRMLSSAKMVFEPLKDLERFLISKQILTITYFGDFFIYLVNESNAFPTKVLIVNAKNNKKPISEEIIIQLKNNIEEIHDLIPIHDIAKYEQKSENNETITETISEVQESENWYDYLPASSEKKHFVGRDKIRTNILHFFKEVRNGETNKRVFYINGKSGWGKSSLVLEIKGRCRNKHYKKKFYATAIDTRSATSDNFVAIAIHKLVNNAVSSGFLRKDMFFDELNFTSTTDLLSSPSMQQLISKLKTENKFLIIIFDQFEDVFRKKNFFKTFYKFHTDVTDKKPNIIVGFSWKSDFFIQSGDPSYHIWQQSKEQAREFTIDEFGEKEIDGIIKQLESSVGDIDRRIKDRIKESSQGLPWLTKKLCIHIFDQINLGIPKEELVESNLNISDLFLKDEERIEADELKALKLIAKKANEGNFFDETEVGDLISSTTITSLLHKRLIIRSGANYNIYWDIYRDYLVTGDIPLIGESYLLRQGVNLCIEVFLLFEKNKKFTIEELLEKHPKNIGQETLNNLLVELRNLGLIQKDSNKYFVENDIIITRDVFVSFITDRFRNYTPYLALKKRNYTRITKNEIIQVLRSTFKQDYQDKTWDAYAKNLISWFLLSNIDIKAKIVEPRKGRGSGKLVLKKEERMYYTPKSSLKEILEIIPLLIIDSAEIINKYHRDLRLIGLINENGEPSDFSYMLISKDEKEWSITLKSKISELPKMKELNKIVKANQRIKAKAVIEKMPDDFFEGKKQSSKIIYASKALTWLR